MTRAAQTMLVLGSLAFAACGGSSGLKAPSCPTGQHNGGDGVCVAVGACSSGYHDGGDGSCWPAGSCATNFRVDGTGVCVQAADAGIIGAGGAGGIAAGGASGMGTGGGTGGIGTGGIGTGGMGTGGMGTGGGTGGAVGGNDGGPSGAGGGIHLDAARGGASGSGGTLATGGTSNTGGSTTLPSTCGNGKAELGEACDCGDDPAKQPSGCASSNGLFYGDGKGCSRTCTKEPSCRDSAGKTQACTSVCGDAMMTGDEECDDGNPRDGDGCSSACKQEAGFTCSTTTRQDATTCQSGTGLCLELPVIYRDFQPQNVTGGHPDFYWLGAGSPGEITTWCVPNAAGPAKGNDATARCWGIAAEDLVDGKPQAGPGKTCVCQFSDWSLGNSSGHIGGRYAQSDSPLYATGGYRADVTSYTANGNPIWKGTVPAYRDANSFSQWFKDDASVNLTYRGVMELASIGSAMYQYASKTRKLDGGFFPLDALNPAQRTLCNMWPYWNAKFFPDCTGDQYLFPPRIQTGDCETGSDIKLGCFLTGLTGSRHDSYFTHEIRYHFVYDGAVGASLQFYGDDDLFIFINGKLVLDLGGVHQQLPGKVTVSGSPGVAKIIEGGCLDTAGNIIGTTAGSTACDPRGSSPFPPTSTPDDFRNRTVDLGLEDGKLYEIAIFGADRHPPESNFQLTLMGFSAKQSVCKPN